MKYSIYINQVGLSETKLDIKDCAILDYLIHFCGADDKKVRQISLTEDGVDYRYTWINFAHLMREMPMLRIKSKGAISARFENLEKEGFIKTFKGPDGNLYVRIMPKVKESQFGEGVHGDERRRSRRRMEAFTAVNSTNSSIMNSNIKTDTIAADAAEMVDFKDHHEFAEYLNSIFRDPKSQPHVLLIANFVTLKGINPGETFDIRSKKAFSEIVSSWGKVASALLRTHPLKRIEETMEILCEYANFDWNLGTVKKYINYSPEKLKESLKSMRKKVYA